MRFKNAPDGSQARQLALGAFGEQRIVDGRRADEAQVAPTQLPPQSEHAALQADVGLPALLAGRVRLIRPVHPLQLLSERALQPILQVSESHAKPARHGALRLSATNRRHHCLPTFFREFFMLNTVAVRPRSDDTSLTNIK